MVVLIVGTVAAIAIPRLSRGAAGAADSALAADLKILQSAIDFYSAEHGGAYPGGATIASQLTLFSNATGAVSPTRTTTHIYGPYIRSIPALPVGTNKGKNAIHADGSTIGRSGFGWLYTPGTGEIRANLVDAEKDIKGVPYNRYGGITAMADDSGSPPVSPLDGEPPPIGP